MQIQETIIKQLGKTFVPMTGASAFVEIYRGIQFSFRGCKTSNKCRIILDEGSDTYTIEFFKLRMTAGTCDLVASRSFVYADNLREVFKTETGLDVSL